MESLPSRIAQENFKGYAGANLALRWLSYEHVQPRYDWKSETYQALGLRTGQETILDVGAGMGHTLIDLALKRGHRGRLIGIDPNPEQFDGEGIWLPHRQSSVNIINRVTFGYGFVQNIPLGDNEADRVISEYQMYMVKNEEQGMALSEIIRVLKPGGKLILSTSGPSNKIRQRALEKRMAHHIRKQPPKLMNASYDSPRALSHLQQHFEQVEHRPLHGHFVYYPDTIDAFKLSLSSMMDQFDPMPTGSEWQDAISSEVTPIIENDFAHFQRFTDFCERDIFVASRPFSK